ncbi:MAG: 6-hydroxy-3-succinoylpyridine hydroxylase, partial [Thiolinea sp.]
QAVLCSNDSDMEGALKAIRVNCPDVRVGVVAPSASPGRHISKDLSKHAHWVKGLNNDALASAQLPEKIPGTSIRRPEGW